MKKIVSLLVILIVFSSCKEEKPTFPHYTLETVNYVPDSLKKEHREWIKETVRAGSQHMTGGDYEDVDETIMQAERTADNLFERKVLGLRKQINENFWDDILLRPDELTPREKKIFDSLTNKK